MSWAEKEKGSMVDPSNYPTEDEMRQVNVIELLANILQELRVMNAREEAKQDKSITQPSHPDQRKPHREPQQTLTTQPKLLDALEKARDFRDLAFFYEGEDRVIRAKLHQGRLVHLENWREIHNIIKDFGGTYVGKDHLKAGEFPHWRVSRDV